MSTENLQTLSELMRDDWNRRIKHDYRFWTNSSAFSNSSASEETLALSGEKDLTACLSGVVPDQLSSMTFLDIGCGVGRFLPSALTKFSFVYGVDVSSEALRHAEEAVRNLPQRSHVSLLEGTGCSLEGVPSDTIDIAVSFDTIGIVPTLALASYLPEINRVLKTGGQARLQIFVGQQTATEENDTLTIRCYENKNLEDTFTACGFALRSRHPMHLSQHSVQHPTQSAGGQMLDDSMHEAQSYLFVIEKRNACLVDVEHVLALLTTPQASENTATRTNIPVNEREYRLSLGYADSLAERGEYGKAKEAVEYAAQFLDTVAIDVRDIFERVKNKLTVHAPVNPAATDFYPANRAIVQKRFPAVEAMLATLVADRPLTVEVKNSQEGPVLFEKNVALDHPNKPLTAATAWVRGLKTEGDVIVVGFGLGYHLEKLLEYKVAKGRVFVVEPSLDALDLALHTRDLTDLLNRVDYLSTTSTAVPTISENATIYVRPQAQLLYPDFVSEIKSQIISENALANLKPAIAVVGPRHGGTLPILGYVSNALSLMNQRIRPYDFSVFDTGYTHIETLLKDKFRQNHAHNQFTEAVSEVALQALSEKPVDIVITLPFAPLSPRVLDELRKRGVITVLWFVEDYQRFDMWKVLAKHYDFVFTIQKGAAIEAIRQAGAGHVSYLPVGCDPMIHSPQILTDQEKARYGSPISFMGSGYHNRQQMFASLSEYPLKLWGTEWPTSRPFDKLVQEDGRRLTPIEYMKVFAATDININLHSSGERDGVDPFGDFVNPRTFELAAAGAFQLVDERSLLPECFKVGEELITFTDERDLKSKINYYLAHPEERRAIAAKARERVLRDHSYITRIRSMMKTIISQRHDVLAAKLAASPWHLMREKANAHPELSERCDRAWLRGEEPTLDGLVSDIVVGKGKLTPTEQRLMFLHHIKRSTIRMREEEQGLKPKGNV